MTLEIKDFEYFNNKDFIVNNGTVTLKDTAAENATSKTVKDLSLSDSGRVEVETESNGGIKVTTTYTNSGVKLLLFAGKLDLSSNIKGGHQPWLGVYAR